MDIGGVTNDVQTKTDYTIRLQYLMSVHWLTSYFEASPVSFFDVPGMQLWNIFGFCLCIRCLTNLYFIQKRF